MVLHFCLPAIVSVGCYKLDCILPGYRNCSQGHFGCWYVRYVTGAILFGNQRSSSCFLPHQFRYTVTECIFTIISCYVQYSNWRSVDGRLLVFRLWLSFGIGFVCYNFSVLLRQLQHYLSTNRKRNDETFNMRFKRSTKEKKYFNNHRYRFRHHFSDHFYCICFRLLFVALNINTMYCSFHQVKWKHFT